MEKISAENIKETLNQLLGKGCVTTEINTNDLNRFLNILEFKAVKWPGTNDVYIVDVSREEDSERRYQVVNPWTDLRIKGFKLVLEQIAKGLAVNREYLKFYEEMKWIEFEGGKVKFSKRALLNFADLLMEINPEKYKLCDICQIIVEGKNRHESCNKMLK